MQLNKINLKIDLHFGISSSKPSNNKPNFRFIDQAFIFKIGYLTIVPILRKLGAALWIM